MQEQTEAERRAITQLQIGFDKGRRREDRVIQANTSTIVETVNSIEIS